MNRRYEKTILRLEQEAQSILEANGLPVTAAALLDKNIQAKNHLISKAQLVVLGAHSLRKEIEKNRIHHALDRFLSICEAYEDMSTYSGASAFDVNAPILTSDYFKSLNEGKKSVVNRGKAISAKSSITEIRRQSYQDFVDKKSTTIKNPTWRKLQNLAAGHFGVSGRTIRKYVRNPYKK